MTMYPLPRDGGENTSRQLLLKLGMGNYNATLAARYMMLAPAATDPAMPAVILMTKHLQQGLVAAGATDVAVTGIVDNATAEQLVKLVGDQWNQVTWYALFGAVISAKRRRALVPPPLDLDASAPSSALGFLDLPDLPGGTITYLALAGAAYYFLVHKKRSR